jgi:arylsulfatase A-like enzyme
MLASYALSTAAVLVVLLRDLDEQLPLPAWILCGGVVLVWAPLWLAEAAGRVLTLPFNVARALAIGAIAIFPAGYACFYLGPIAFESMPVLLGGTVALVLGAVLGGFFWGRLVSERAALPVAVPLVACFSCALLIWPHEQESTLSAITRGSERERTLVFLGTWAASLGLACALSINALSRLRFPLRPALRWSAFVLCALAGVTALEADRRVLHGHYPYFHAWLQVVAIVSLEAAFGLLCVALISAWPWLTRSFARLGAVNLLFLGASAAGFLFVSFVPSALPLLRARMATAAVAPLLFELQPKSALDVLPPDEDHPLLHAPLHHERRLAGQPFHILLITVDALRGDALKHAPQLKAFAERSSWFQNTYSPGTRTAMALSALTTARYSAHLDWELWINTAKGMTNVRTMTPAQRAQIGPRGGYTTFPDFHKFTTLAQRMKRAGFYTMATPYLGDKAKWVGRGVGFELGFDDYLEFPRMLSRNDSSTPVIDRALRQLQRAQGKRWFQWVHLFDPHEARGSPARYRRLVKNVDDAFVDVLAALDERGLREQTVIMITGDHGEGFGPDHPTNHATSLYEDQTRVPLILHVPGLAPQQYRFPTSSLDGIATLLALADADLSGADGLNLLPWMIERREAPHRPVFTELHRYVKGPRTQDLKALILGDYKLLFDRRNGTLRLFNVKLDPRERRDLSEREPVRFRELAAVLGAFVHAAERVHPLP